MKLHERYAYLSNLLEKAEEKYKKAPLFSTELEIISLKEECRQLLAKKNEEEQYIYPREEQNFYALYPCIQKSSMDLIKKLDDTIDLPINVQRIAISCGFDKIEPDDGSRSGKHATAKGNIIYVNKNELDEEQRFSIAHEIGHRILDSRRDIINNVARKGNRWKANILQKGKPISHQEKEMLVWEEIIDYFAANLLMPTQLFKEYSSQPDEIIAKKFKVSEKSLQKRRREIIHEINSD
jgi:Zn-dependent peptidase ImmA (M78 family)